MRSILIFGEDYAHEVFLRSLVERMSAEAQVPLEILVRSATGGHGRLLRELREFITELQRGRGRLPDLFIVARDANCQGYATRANELQGLLGQYGGLSALAIPDPHIERWLLLDSRAFKAVLGQGCQLPAQKCDRNRYKKLFSDEVRNAGIEPLLGGIEFAEDIVKAISLQRAATADKSFAHLLNDLRGAFKRWQPT